MFSVSKIELKLSKWIKVAHQLVEWCENRFWSFKLTNYFTFFACGEKLISRLNGWEVYAASWQSLLGLCGMLSYGGAFFVWACSRCGSTRELHSTLWQLMMSRSFMWSIKTRSQDHEWIWNFYNYNSRATKSHQIKFIALCNNVRDGDLAMPTILYFFHNFLSEHEEIFLYLVNISRAPQSPSSFHLFHSAIIKFLSEFKVNIFLFLVPRHHGEVEYRLYSLANMSRCRVNRKSIRDEIRRLMYAKLHRFGGLVWRKRKRKIIVLKIFHA